MELYLTRIRSSRQYEGVIQGHPVTEIQRLKGSTNILWVDLPRKKEHLLGQSTVILIFLIKILTRHLIFVRPLPPSIPAHLKMEAIELTRQDKSQRVKGTAG